MMEWYVVKQILTCLYLIQFQQLFYQKINKITTILTDVMYSNMHTYIRVLCKMQKKVIQYSDMDNFTALNRPKTYVDRCIQGFHHLLALINFISHTKINNSPFGGFNFYLIWKNVWGQWVITVFSQPPTNFSKTSIVQCWFYFI